MVSNMMILASRLNIARLRKRQVHYKMYAVIKTGGKQYQVSEGDIIFIEKLDAEAEQDVVFDEVLVVGKEDGIVAGTPLVAGATVTGKLIKNGRGKKITVFTYKRRKGKQRKVGHRQAYSQVRIESINA